MNHPYSGMVDPRRMMQGGHPQQMMMRPPVSNFIQRPLPSNFSSSPQMSMPPTMVSSVPSQPLPDKPLHRPFDDIVQELKTEKTEQEVMEKEEEEEDAATPILREEDILTIKNTVKRWLELDDEMMRLQQAIVERKKEKNKLNNVIIEFMKNHKTPFFDFDNGHKLVLSTSSAKQPLNKIFIQQILKQMLTDEKANEIEKMLLENRPMVEKHKLKRTKPREKKKKN